MPTMVLLEPLRATALSGYARGHRVYMGTGKRRMLPATHATLILTLEPGSGLWLNRQVFTVARFHCWPAPGAVLFNLVGS